MPDPRKLYTLYQDDLHIPMYLDMKTWKYGELTHALQHNSLLHHTSLAGGPWVGPLTRTEYHLRNDEIRFRNLDHLSYIRLPDGFLLEITWTPRDIRMTFTANLVFYVEQRQQPQSIVIAPDDFIPHALRLPSRSWLRTSELEKAQRIQSGPYDVILLLPLNVTSFQMTHQGRVALRREDQPPPDQNGM